MSLRTNAKRYHAVFLSDLHVGTRSFRAEALLAFLDGIEATHVYLVGDILDLGAVGTRWFRTPAHRRAMTRLLDLPDVVYVPGNHDALFHDHAGLRVGGLVVAAPETRHRDVLVTHGDRFDAWSQHYLIGTIVYSALAAVSPSVAGTAKRWFNRRSGFVGRAVEYAAARGNVAGIICGHNHIPATERHGNLTYYNIGEGVDECTAIVEDEYGLRHVRWRHPMRRSVSFVVPALNEERLLPACLRSIRDEAIRYPGLSWEIVVVDNGSADATARVAEAAGARVVTEPRRGLLHARQAGYVAAEGDLLAFVDADCRLPEGWLLRAVEALTPGRAVVSGPFLFDDLPGWVRWSIFYVFYAGARLANRSLGANIQGGNYLVRREALDACGGMNTSIDFYGEDTDTAIRLSRVGKVRMCGGMWTHTSSRRLRAEGVVRIGWRYVVNYVWVALTGRPWTVAHEDFR